MIGCRSLQQLLAKTIDDRDDRNGNPGDNQTIFDGVVIFQKTQNKVVHGKVPVLPGPDIEAKFIPKLTFPAA
jgi:hypothetical protein